MHILVDSENVELVECFKNTHRTHLVAKQSASERYIFLLPLVILTLEQNF